MSTHPNSTHPERTEEKAVFAMGCFWKPQAIFDELPGVTATRVGYAGGHAHNPSYEQVCTKTTGHAEIVEITFDPAQISYEALLKMFWENHDPTQVNRQGPDVGDQYRTAIFPQSPAQEEAARAAIAAEDASGRHPAPVATRIERGEVWPAEDYHQHYVRKRSKSPLSRLFG